MSQTNPIELTNMALITNDQGQFLVQQRLKPDWPGITFPGGHIEPGNLVMKQLFAKSKKKLV